MSNSLLLFSQKAGNQLSRQDAIDQITKVKPVQVDENINLKIQNYPNPFSSSTIISFKIPEGLGQVYTHLKVYDLQGKLVRVLLSEQLPSGNYLTRWNRDDSSGTKVNAGIYILRIVIGNSTGTLQMVVTN